MVSLSTPQILGQCYLPNLSYLLVNESELKNKCFTWRAGLWEFVDYGKGMSKSRLCTPNITFIITFIVAH